MATYSENDFNTAHYNTARPSYPDLFYQTLVQYHKEGNNPKFQSALDVGCGSGFVTFKLTEFFETVTGTDISATMIGQCQADLRASSKIQFAVAPGEKSPEFIGENSVDMITAAECCHWFDHDLFFRECHRILKPGGTLAFWFYLDPVFPGHEKANQLYTEYAYGLSVAKYGDAYERFFGDFYEQPGHEFFRTAMASVSVPEPLYEDIVRHHYVPKAGENGEEITSLYIERVVPLSVYKDYVTSWSGYHNWKKVHGDKPDTADRFIEELSEAMGVDVNTPVRIVFPTVYTFARKK